MQIHWASTFLQQKEPANKTAQSEGAEEVNKMHTAEQGTYQG